MADILIVDDDRQNLELLKLLLECEGIEAHCASSGEEALPKITERTFSLMITDLNMHGMNGFELSRKAQEIAPRMPIIMSTGDFSPEITRLAMEIGIAKILAKPFHPHRMLATIRGVLGKWSVRKDASSAR
ncbi:MAG TPA: response regulator [Geobacteraceae bacterium]